MKVHVDSKWAHCGHYWGEGENPCQHFQPGHGEYTSVLVKVHYVLGPEFFTWQPTHCVLTLVEA